jgi:hypothetical protein
MRNIIVFTFIVIISGCASVKTNDFSMETSNYIPEEKYYRGGNYSVFVLSNKALSAKDNVSVDLHKIAKSMVEKALLTTGTVELANNRNNADYIVESGLETANYGKKNVNGNRYHIASTAGRVRIYDAHNEQLIRDIPFDDNAREVSIDSNSRDTIYREALYTSIGYGVYDHLKEFFSPKGLILEGDKVGGDYHLKVRLNGGLAKEGDVVNIFSIEKLDSPLLGKIEINHKKICDGEIIEDSDSSIVIVEVDSDCDVKKGYYISMVHNSGFFGKGLNAIGKGINKALRKNPIK